MNSVDRPDLLSELIRLAHDRVFARTGSHLTDVQERILEQALAGKKLKHIQVPGYGDKTVQNHFCPKLWQVLSESFEPTVRLNTVRLTLEKALKQTQSSTSLTSSTLPQSLSSFPEVKLIPHNLPAPSCTTFIGREAELVRLLDLLSPRSAAHLISVDGIGGVGKTTLVLEAAYRCLRASCGENSNPTIPAFDVIIFTSAKELRLTPLGLLKSLSPRRTLNDLFHQIARVVDELEITGISFEEQLDRIQDTLAKHRTLLIVDNLETVTDQQDVLAFLYELPPTVKAVITTREQIIFVPVRLTSMPEQDGLSLIQQEAQEKEVLLTDSDRLNLYWATGGIPVAISYAIGQLANGFSIQEVLQKIAHPTGDVARFCFETSVQSFRNKPAHHLLMTLALFPTSSSQDALVQVATPKIDPDSVQQDLARLRGLSLVKQDHHRYSMLPLTREYALAELKAHPDFAQEVRQRWLTWYLGFSTLYARFDSGEWLGLGFEDLEVEWQNLQAVMEWCMAAGCYAEVVQLWRNLRSYTQVRGRHISRLGCWSDRLTWTAWLMDIAEQRGDWKTFAQMTLDHAWTLTALGKSAQLEMAEVLLLRVWKLRHHQDSMFQVTLIQAIAVLLIQQQRFEEAQTWLNQAEQLLQQTGLEEPGQIRQRIQIDYYRGEILFKQGAYEPAKALFVSALNAAHQLHWVRAMFIVQNWLAEIAIFQGQADEAQHLLMDGLQVAEANQDRTRMAYCQRSLAKLSLTQGNQAEAVNWATEALKTFEALGMIPEAEETQSFLESNSKISQQAGGE
jgi:tetratricopeptide (TPR) repeat protein